MRTYDERIANIRAKAKATKTAYRAITATFVTLSLLAVAIGGVWLHPELLLGFDKEPTYGPALQTPTSNQRPGDVLSPTHPSPAYPDVMEPTSPADVVAFRASSVKCNNGSKFSWGPAVIHSVEELEQLYSREIRQYGDQDTSASLREQLAQYSDDFFADRTLIVLMRRELGSLDGIDITDVFLAGNALYINIDRKVPAIGSPEEEYWYLFVEVENSLPKHINVCAQFMVNGSWMEPAWRAYEISFEHYEIYCGGMPEPGEGYPRTEVIASVEELKAFCATLGDMAVDVKAYDPAYFETNTLIALWNPVGSSSVTYSVSNVFRMDDHGISICVDQFVPQAQSDDVMSWLFIIEAQEHISHYTKIAVDYNTRVEIDLPEYTEPTQPTEPLWTTTPIEPPEPTVPEIPPEPPIVHAGEIPFRTQTVYYGAPDVDPEREYVDVIRSVSELQAYLLKYQQDLSAETAKYDETFFENHTLLALWNMRYSSTVEFSVTEIFRLSNSMIYIRGESYKPEYCGEDDMTWLIFIEAVGEISRGAKIRVDYQNITETLPPERPEDTDLEFWIGQNVADVDFSAHDEVYGWFGARKYLGKGYQMRYDATGEQQYPKEYVSYLVGAFPDEADGGSFVTCIEIRDAAVQLYGLNILSAGEEFEAVFRSMAYSVEESNGTWTARKNGVTFTFRQGEYLMIRAQVTNREGIIY